jgi:hypothetical protein
MLGTFIEPKEEVTGGWRKLHNGECIVLTPCQIIIMIKSTVMRWMVNAAGVEEMRMHRKF